MTDRTNIKVSTPTVRRLPRYLQVLKRCSGDQAEYVSSTHIAAELGYEAIQVRKDIEVLGVKGQPRVGYRTMDLVAAIESFLSWDNENDAFLIGVGHLGRALIGYKGFSDYGLRIIAGFDANESLAGQEINGVQVFGMDRLAELIIRMRIHIAVLAVPASVAQEVADIIISSGVVGIWNFTPVRLNVPDDVIVERVDLASSLAVLSRKTSKLLKARKSDAGI